MDSRSHQRGPAIRHPLLPIGLILLAMLMLPAFLYSVAPDEPLKPGVMVFAHGKQRVYFVEPGPYQPAGYTNYCVLEPRDPLVVLGTPSEQTDATWHARFEGKRKVEFPFCPPHAIVMVKSHQVIQKETLWHELKDLITNLRR